MPAWLNILLGLVVIVGFAGSAIIYLRGSRDKGTIEALERNNRALSERVQILEEDAARCAHRLEVLEKENKDLRAQRPSAKEIAEILRLTKLEFRILLKLAAAAGLKEDTDGH